MEGKDFENPLDTDADNVYNVTLKVIDEDNNKARKKIKVTVLNVEESQSNVMVPIIVAPPVTENLGKPFIFKQEPVEGSIIFYMSDLDYNVKIDWGDGTTSENISETISHEYNTSGIKTLKVWGTYPQPVFGGDRPSAALKMSNLELNAQLMFVEVGEGDNLNIVPSNRVNSLRSITQWGDIKWKSMEGSFRNCENLVLEAEDAPNLSDVSSLKSMFEGIGSFNANINSWDVSNIRHMDRMFANISSFNQPLDDWNVSKVISTSNMFSWAISFNQSLSSWDTNSFEDMSGMFNSAFRFNQPLDSWDVSNVSNMSNLFNGAGDFNQPLDSWDVSNVIDMSRLFSSTTFNQPLNSWDVSSVNNMEKMFSQAISFNQNIDSWDVSTVSNMKSMFTRAGAFNQNLGSWNITKLQDASFMLESTLLSIENYVKLLNGWVDMTPESNVTFSVGTVQYTKDAVDARATLVNELKWTITDGGLYPIPIEISTIPVGTVDSATTEEDTEVIIDVLQNDIDVDGDSLIITNLSIEDNAGTVSIVDNKVKYIPSKDFTGTETFTYTPNDGTVDGSEVNVTVSVSNVNDAPVAIDDTFTINKNTSLTILKSELTSNDTDVDGDTLTVTRVSNPTNGTVFLNADVTVEKISDLTSNNTYINDNTLTVSNVSNLTIETLLLDNNTITFTPTENFVGEATFTYVITDGKGKTAEATVRISVKDEVYS